MAGIAALGAVLAALGDGRTFLDSATLQVYRERLSEALRDAFPGATFNAPPALCLPTTLNFSVPGVSAKTLIDLFDAAQVRVSGGSACGAAKALPSDVLEAMGLPAWRTASAVRLSFGPAADEAFIDEACRRIRACGASLRRSCMSAAPAEGASATDDLQRFIVDGACCYVVADASSRRCVVIDPLPELTDTLARWVACQGYDLTAVLDTHSHGDHASSAPELRARAGHSAGPLEALGWPEAAAELRLGGLRLTRLAIPGHTQDSTAYLLHDAQGLRYAFVGDTVMPGALGRSDFQQSAPASFGPSLKALEQALGQNALLLPGHDYDDRFATTLAIERAAQPLLASVLRGELDANGFAAAKATLEQSLALTAYQTLACGACVDSGGALPPSELHPAELATLVRTHPGLHWVDVREAYEQRMGGADDLPASVRYQAVPLTGLINALPVWLDAAADTPVVFVCRSGNRSAQAARALRRLGHAQAWSLAGGLALWPREVAKAKATA